MAKTSKTVQTKGIDNVPAVKAETFNYREIPNIAADKAIKEIRTKGKSLRKLAHETACGIAIHFVIHGDYTKMQSLRDAISEGIGKNMANAFADWTEKFTTCHFSKGKLSKQSSDMKNLFCGMGKDDFDAEKIATFVSPDGNKFRPFYDMEKVPSAPKAIDFAERLEAFLKEGIRLLSEKTDGKEITAPDGKKETVKIAHKIDKKTVADLKAFAATHGVKGIEVPATIQ